MRMMNTLDDISDDCRHNNAVCAARNQAGKACSRLGDFRCRMGCCGDNDTAYSYDFEKTKGIDVVMYLALGWLIIISIKTLWEVFSRTGVIFLISGGIAYTLGVILYGIGSKSAIFTRFFISL